jgi:predicted metal-dependent hydrolase
MITERQQIIVSGIPVEVVRKEIKNLHLAVYPPGGRVRVAVPSWLRDETVRLAVVSRLGWIRRQRTRFAEQVRQSEREMVTGETHFFRGRPYRLVVIAREERRAEVRTRNDRRMELRVPRGLPAQGRRVALNQWYRQELRRRIPALIAKWEPIVGVSVAEWRIRRMRTRWGTCNPTARRVWLNLELAKKQPPCLEYVVVHEMVHLLERHHSPRFQDLMDRFMPNWKQHREQLNQAPLAHETWRY